jgi:salicylate hydroxylase
MLEEHAIQEGVQIRYNSKVVHVESESVSVLLKDGERISSDVVIGADGFRSLVRTAVIGKTIPENRERDISLNFTIPTDLMREDVDLKPLTNSTDVRRFRHASPLSRNTPFKFCYDYSGLSGSETNICFMGVLS